MKAARRRLKRAAFGAAATLVVSLSGGSPASAAGTV